MNGRKLSALAGARHLAASVAVLVLAASTGWAQGISGISAVKNPGNSADSFEDTILAGAQGTSVVAVQPGATATAFSVRYSEVIGTDTGIYTGRTVTLNSNYTISFSVTAPGSYSLAIDTRRLGALTLVDDGSAAATATLGAVTGVPTGGVFGGSLTLGSVPTLSGNGGGNTPLPITQTSAATITGTSNGVPQPHTLTFSWTGSCNSVGSFPAAITGGDECAVRMGITTGYGGETASDYPGVGGRVIGNDGHFVDVVLTSPCGNGIVEPGENEACDEGVNNGTAGSCCNTDCSLKAAATPCRAAAGGCDVAEACDGIAGACPADALVPAATVCRAASSGELCDIDEVCDGIGVNCPADAVEPIGTVCRAVAGACDIQEVCDGVGTFCPADVVEPAGTTCRASAGLCDVAEQCNGTGAQCAADGFVTAGTVCRPSVGGCDPQEQCTGSGSQCPADALSSAGTVCRASAGDCDAQEQCDGIGDQCPADAKESAGTECRASAGACDIAEVCDGVTDPCPADVVVAAATVCRASAGECDVAEACDGVATACPPNGFVSNGTVCTDDGLFCTGDETCQSGACTGSGDPCTVGVCDEMDDVCFEDGCTTVPLACRTALKSTLLIKDKADNSKDRLVWKWVKGQTTSQGDFSNPTTMAKYNLCLYAGTTAALVAEANVEPSALNWSTLSTKGYKYKDNAGTQDGIQRAILKGSTNDKSKVLVKGKGINLPDPTLPFDLSVPLLTQFVNQQNGICFEATYNLGSIKKNEAGLFKAKAQ